MKLKNILGFLRDIAIAAGIIGVLLLAIFLYTGNWPPMVVIESDSMQHGDDSELGVIDTGDLVLVKELDGDKDLVSYVKGRATGYKTYSEYGDVIIYRKNGGADTPVIHRPVLYLNVNETTNNSFDIPNLKKLEYGKEMDWYITISENTLITKARWYNLGENHQIHINEYGYARVHLKINLMLITKNFGDHGMHDGFITVGDRNAARNAGSCVDQEHLETNPSSKEKVRPVKTEWIIGKARGELPWFGIVKLKFSGEEKNEFPSTSIYMMFVTLAVVIALPIVVDFIYHVIKKKIKGDTNTEDEKDKKGEDPDAPEDSSQDNDDETPIPLKRSSGEIPPDDNSSNK
ncbi:MAG: S26 family signal peptidase [Candidatus Thermoplasmatota archaeon]|jgi:signal peptidase|nr:S26 family signal peptidase [Candidatus Thermoplasmatota archaeon]